MRVRSQATGSGPSDAKAGSPASVPAIMAPPVRRENPFFRSVPGLIGLGVLVVMLAVCLGSLPYTLGADEGATVARYNEGAARAGRLPPAWVTPTPDQARRLNALVPEPVVERLAAAHGVTPDQLRETTTGPPADAMREYWPRYALGTDVLGRSLLLRVLTGGGISLVIGVAAAALSVLIGTLYGAIAGYAGGRIDAVMMRAVDVLYGLPYVLLVVLLAVASTALIEEYQSRHRERTALVNDRAAAIMTRADPRADTSRVAVERFLSANPDQAQALRDQALAERAPRQFSPGTRTLLEVLTLLIAIGGVSWLTMARVIRGQVMSLKAQPFVEAARAMGAGTPRIFFRHLLPNLTGPITVYATLTVPQAILQESFLSFLGIGVRPPLPSWGNLAAEGLSELNPYQSNWWLLVFPCLLLAVTLLAMNFLGEGLREALDPKRRR